MSAISNGKLDGWPSHLKTAYVDSGSNVDPVFEAQPMLKYLVDSTGRTEEECVAKLKELEFTDQMMKGTIGALSGGWQMKHRIVRAVLIDPDIYLLGKFGCFLLEDALSGNTSSHVHIYFGKKTNLRTIFPTLP
jgi:elongation factor 3